MALRISGAYCRLHCVSRYLYLEQLFYSCCLLKIITVKYDHQKSWVECEKECNLVMTFRLPLGLQVALVHKSQVVVYEHSEADLGSDIFN